MGSNLALSIFQSRRWGKEAGCFTVIVFLMFVGIWILCLNIAVPWVGMRSVIISFPNCTRFRPGVIESVIISACNLINF